MRFSTSTVAFAATLALGVCGADFADIPGYALLPKPTGNKYSAETTLAARSVAEPGSAIHGSAPSYPIDSLEPTHIPEEDLHPNTIHARTVDEPVSVQDQPSSDDYPHALHTRSVTEDNAEHLDAPEYPTGYHEHFARSEDAPEGYDDRIPEDGYREYQRLHTRSAEPDSYSEYEDHLSYTSEQEHEGATLHERSVEDDSSSEKFETAEDVAAYLDKIGYKFDDELQKRSVDEEADHIAAYLSKRGVEPEDESTMVYARSVDEDPSWDKFETADDVAAYLDKIGYNYDDELHERSVDQEADHIAAYLSRRSEDSTDDYVDNAHPGHNLDFEKRSLADEDDSEDDYYYRFMQRDVESEDESSETASSEISSSLVSDAPSTPAAAAAPTPAPTSANTVTSTAAPTAASQWSDVQSETAASTWNSSKKVHSHPRFRHHYTTTQASSSGSATTTTTTSSTTSRRGFFHLPW